MNVRKIRACRSDTQPPPPAALRFSPASAPSRTLRIDHVIIFQQQISVQFLFPPQAWQAVCPPSCITIPAAVRSPIIRICVDKLARAAPVERVVDLQCALKECRDNRRPMEHSRRFGRALMSSIQRTPIAAGVSLRGIRGAPAKPEALRNGQRSCPGRIGAPRFATCLPCTRRRYSCRPSNPPHAMQPIRTRRACRAGSCTRAIHGMVPRCR